MVLGSMGEARLKKAMASIRDASSLPVIASPQSSSRDWPAVVFSQMTRGSLHGVNKLAIIRCTPNPR
jgi:hypothetical protein